MDFRSFRVMACCHFFLSFRYVRHCVISILLSVLRSCRYYYYCHFATLLFQYFDISPFRYLAILQLCYYTPSCHFTILLGHYLYVNPFCNYAISGFYHFNSSPFSHFTILPFHHFAFSIIYHFTISHFAPFLKLVFVAEYERRLIVL